MARTKIGGDAPLLPGSANLFRDGVFIGSEDQPLVRPGEETTLGFGVDDQVVVKRQVVADTTGSSGILTKNTTREKKVVSSIQNLHKMPVKLEVLETVPVPRNEQIKFDMIGDATTDGYARDVENTTGLYRWSLDLQAGAKSDVKLGWRLSWPAGVAITGAD